MDALNRVEGTVNSQGRMTSSQNSDRGPLFWKKLHLVGRGQSFAFLICLFLVCGAAAFTGAVPTQIYGHDDFFWLDNAWRVVCGLRPHLDFYSPWGPVMYLIEGLAMIISKGSPNALGYASALVGLLIGLWSYGLGRSRLANPFNSILGIYLALLVTAPYALGTSPFWSTHAMVHNRYGFALVGLVLLECLQEQKCNNENNAGLWGGISTGAAVALALFLKASYFLVTLPFVGLSLAFRKRRRDRLAGLAIGFGAIAFCLMAYLKFDIIKYGLDMRMAAVARSTAMTIALPVIFAEFVGASVSLIVVAALFLYANPGTGRGTGWWEQYELLASGLLVFAADLLLMFSNLQWRGMPLLGVFGIVVASRISSEWHWGTWSTEQRNRRIFALLLCGILSLPQLCLDTTGLIYGTAQKAHPSLTRSRVRFTSPRLAALIFYDGPFEKKANGGVYTGRINEGIALLKRFCGPDDRVLNMDMVNPFPYALGWRPPHGGMAAIGYNYLFSDKLRPSDDEYFGNATIVMVPKEPALDDRYYGGYYRIYYPAMLKRYRLAAESESWRMYDLAPGMRGLSRRPTP